MAIAMTLENYLNSMHISYELVPHRRTLSSMESATAAHVPSHCIAKGVLLRDEKGYLMAVLPADRHVPMDELRRQLGRKVELASEDDVYRMFRDCEPGAIPPVGSAYGLETFVDTELTKEPEVYMEAGNHHELVHLSRDGFKELFRDARHWQFAMTH